MPESFSFIGAGDVLLDIFDAAGNSTGLQLKGNCPEIKIKGESETKQQIGSGRTNFGQAIATVVIPKPHTCAFTFNQLDAELFALAFSGTSAALAQTAAAVVDQPVIAVHDKWVELGKMMVSLVVVEHTTGLPVYVLGTDYEVNTRLGMVMVKSTGAILNGASLNVSYSHALIAGSRVSGATRSSVLARVVVDGMEQSTGRNFIFNGKKVRLSANAEVALIGDNFISCGFDGQFETPAGEASPYDLTFLS